MNKKFQLNNLFTSYAQFCNCAPGADTSADFDSLQGSAVAARKRIVAIIGNNTFSDIVGIEEEEWHQGFSPRCHGEPYASYPDYLRCREPKEERYQSLQVRDGRHEALLYGELL